MSDVAAPLPRIPRWFILALALLTVSLIVLGILRSNRSTLRGDEVVTLFHNRKNPGIGEMLRGEPGIQVSPAPGYYVLGRLVDEARTRVDYLGLRPSGYFRLPSQLFTAFLGAAAAGLVASRLQSRSGPESRIAYFLVLCGIAVFWFQPKVFSFACIDRPYALWNGLWLLTLAWLLARPESRIGLGILMTLMATTATAACFQILAMGVAFAIVRRLEGRSAKQIARDGALLFSIPAAVGLFYALRSTSEDFEIYSAQTAMLREQLRYWFVTNLHAWILAALGVVLVWRRPSLRAYAFPVLAFVVLLLLAPLLYSLASLRGFASPSRYSIWTTTALPLALFLAALGWPELGKGKAAAPVAVIFAAGLVAGFSIATFFRPPARNDSRLLTCLDPGSPLEQLLRTERPALLAFPSENARIEFLNLILIGEWIETRYRALPVGITVVHFLDSGGALIVEQVDRTGRGVPMENAIRISP